jgi:hypothetical protein
MIPAASKPLPAFGFLTAVEDPLHGFFGGYLVVCHQGRPLEFHCSIPILPNEAQRILYGASLRPYLLGEIIGHTLIAKAQVPVQAVVTDLAEMCSLASLVATPVAWLRQAGDCPDFASLRAKWDCPALRDDAPDTFVLGGYAISCAAAPESLRDLLEPLAAQIELAEPFERIREAIREAQRVTDPPGETEHESAAAA